MKVLIDLPPEVAKELFKIAKNDKRSRKSYIELLIINHVKETSKKKK